jgi:hypothetical protein
MTPYYTNEELRFKSESTYTLGKRMVFVVLNDRDRVRGDWSGILNEVVEIDGVRYACTGVESYALNIIRSGSPIGLLVKNL